MLSHYFYFFNTQSSFNTILYIVHFTRNPTFVIRSVVVLLFLPPFVQTSESGRAQSQRRDQGNHEDCSVCTYVYECVEATSCVAAQQRLVEPDK